MNGIISDNELIKLYIARDVSASKISMEKYSARLTRLASTFLSDKRDVEECVNDTFMKAWNSIPPQNPMDFFSFLARICRCTAYDIIKRGKTAKRNAQIVEFTKEMEECIPDMMSETELSDKKLETLMNDFLEKLSRDNRVIFVRHYWFGETVSEIAGSFSFSESKVKTSLHRTREKLKEYLFKKGVSL